MRQSGSALRKLIRSVAAAGVSSGNANAVRGSSRVQQRSYRRRQGRLGQTSNGPWALSSLGDGLSAWSQRIVVEQRGWLSNEEFFTGLTVARLFPGPNQISMAF